MSSKKKGTSDLLDTFGALKDKRTGHDDKWIENFKRLFMYKEYTDEEAEDILLGIKADIRQPRELSHNETKRPRIVNTIFSYDPIARAIPMTSESVDKAKAAEALTNQIVRKKLYIPYFHATTQALYAGVGVFGMGMRTVKVGNGELDDVFFDFCDIFGFYVPDGYIEIQDAPYIYRRMLKPRSYLKKYSDRYKNIDEIPVLGSTSEVISDSYYVQRQDILGFNTGNKETGAAFGATDEKDDIIELVEKWEPDRVTTIANRETTVRDYNHKRGFIPFYAIKDYPSENSFYALSEFDMTGDTFEYQEETKNLRVDIMRRVAYPAVLVSDKAKIADRDLVIRPYQVIRTSDMDGYKEVQRAEVKRALFDEEYIGKSDQENLTGIFSYLKGGDTPRAETATTGIMMKESGMERINTTIFYNSEACMKPMFNDLFKMLVKNLKLGMWAQVINEKGNLFPKKLKQDDIDGMFEWSISAFEIRSISDVNLQQNMISLYDRYLKSSNVNLYELDKLLAKTFNIKNVNDLLIKGPQKQILDTIIANKDFAAMMMQIVEHPERIEMFLSIMGQMNKQQEQTGAAPQQQGQQTMPGTAGVNMESPVATMNAESREPIGDVGRNAI
jgi:hypothetical protein